MGESERTGKTAGERIRQVVQVLGVIAIFAIMVHTLANAFMRFAFESPLHNAIEIITYWYMLVLAYVGFVLAKLAGQTMDAPIIFDKLTWGNRRLLMVFSNALGTVFCAATAYFTFTGEALPAFDVEKTAGASTLPVWPVLFVVPLVFAVLTVLFAIDTVKAIGGHIDATAEDPEAALADDDLDFDFDGDDLGATESAGTRPPRQMEETTR